MYECKQTVVITADRIKHPVDTLLSVRKHYNAKNHGRGLASTCVSRGILTRRDILLRNTVSGFCLLSLFNALTFIYTIIVRSASHHCTTAAVFARRR